MNIELDRLLNALFFETVDYTIAPKGSKEEDNQLEKIIFIKAEIQKLFKEETK